jgi:hypothetical protein
MQTQKRAARQTIEPQDFLLPDPATRRKSSMMPIRPIQVEDAVFEVVAARPRPRPQQRTNDNPTSSRHAVDTDVLPIAARIAGRMIAAAEQRLSKLSPQAFVMLMTSMVVGIFWICGGFSALNASTFAGPTAPFALVDTFTRTQDANGMKVALVSGGVRNTSDRIINAPRLAVVSGGSGDIVGTVVLSVDRIGPGVTIPFSGRFRLSGGKSTELAIIPERL